MKIDSMETFLYDELRDLYDAEKQLTKALPKLAKAAQSSELREALQEHLAVTEQQVSRLEEVFESLGQTAKSKTCDGMKGLIEEGKSIIEEEDATEPFFDAAIIAAAQKVEHYEIAAYGTVRELAERLGNQKAADLLQESLDEEKQADETLTEIAMQLLDGQLEVMASHQPGRMQTSRDEAEPARAKRTRRAS